MDKLKDMIRLGWQVSYEAGNDGDVVCTVRFKVQDKIGGEFFENEISSRSSELEIATITVFNRAKDIIKRTEEVKVYGEIKKVLNELIMPQGRLK